MEDSRDQLASLCDVMFGKPDMKNMRTRTLAPHPSTKTSLSITRIITSEEEKHTENEGDDTSLPWAKQHQCVTSAVQERAIETALLLSYVC